MTKPKGQNIKAGKGRPKHPSGEQQSKTQVRCVVPECGRVFWADKIKSHYLTTVKYYENGEPVNLNDEGEGSNITEATRCHTTFFLQHGYTTDKLSPIISN